MNVCVQLNDIFDTTTPTVMEQRVQYAFGTDGTDFWENFFFCDKYHPNEKEIYLFTEYQLWFLWDWWNKKNNTSKNIQLNLDYSKWKLFNAMRKGKRIEEIRACYVSSHNCHLKIKRVYFGTQPTRYLSQGGLRKVDFFDGRFYGEPADRALTKEDYRKQLLNLAAMRKEIAGEFGVSVKNDKKWLRYLGPQYVDLKFIDYCTGLNSSCPIKKINKYG